MMLKMDDDHHNIDNYVIYNRSSVLGGFELRFRSDGYTLPFVDNIGLNAAKGGTLEQGFIQGSSWPSLYNTKSGKNIGGKYVQLTMVYKTYLGATSADNTMDFTMYLDGQELYNVRRTGGFESRYGNLLRFGGTSWSSDTYSSMKGTIGSIMGYDRDLTAEEVAQNARANQMRYNSAASLRGDTVNKDTVSSGSNVVSKTITVDNGKATLDLTREQLDQLLVSADPKKLDAEVDGRQLYVRIKKDGSYLGGQRGLPAEQVRTDRGEHGLQRC